MHRLLVAAALLSLVTCSVGCNLVRGEVVLVNSEAEPRLYHVASGMSPPVGDDVDFRSLARIDPGERVVLGKAEALADSGGVTVTVFAIPSVAGAQPEIVRVDAVGDRFLRDTIGDTILDQRGAR